MGVAVIAGAGPGIGGAVAKHFAAKGYQVCVARRNGDKLEPLVREIRDSGGACEGFSCDFRKEDSVKELVETIENRFGGISVGVHNIGANIGHVPLGDTTTRVFTKVWEMATLSAFLFGREVADRMVTRGEGTILVTGATASTRGGAGFSAFSSAKMGKRALTQAMARELGPKGIHVAHIIIDGVVNTEPTRQFFSQQSKAFSHEFDLKAKSSGLLEPDEVAEAYWQLHNQPKSTWTHELDLRPWSENW